MELFNGIREQGKYNDRFDLDGSLGSGIYFLKLQTGSGTITDKLVIAR